jgi:hypothetical protein
MKCTSPLIRQTEARMVKLSINGSIITTTKVTIQPLIYPILQCVTAVQHL